MLYKAVLTFKSVREIRRFKNWRIEIKIYAEWLFSSEQLKLRLLRTFAGVLGEKIRVRAILKENTANYISLKSLINVDFGKKYKLLVSSIPQKKIAINCENDHVSFNWINGVSNPSSLAK